MIHSLSEMVLPSVILVGGLLFIVRLLVGRRIFERAVGHLLYDISLSLIRAPFRLARALIRQVPKTLSNHH
jgi:hypothetical protein